MRLMEVLGVVLGELGIGTALFVCVQRVGEIRPSFFKFQSQLVSVCFFLMSVVSQGSRFYAAYYFPPAVFALLAAWNFGQDRPRRGKAFLLFAGLLAAFFLVGQAWISEPRTGSRTLALANLAAGTLLFGWSNGAMILGHWYLIMRGLSFSHFQRATLQLLVTVAVRVVLLVVACVWVMNTHTGGKLPPPTADGLFLGMRILWGLMLPAVFGFMAWRCALTGSNQAGTGLLYIAEVAVLIGEILSGYLGL